MRRLIGRLGTLLLYLLDPVGEPETDGKAKCECGRHAMLAAEAGVYGPVLYYCGRCFEQEKAAKLGVDNP